MGKYFKPRSVAWWSSVAPLVAGIILALSSVVGWLTPVATVIDAATGGLPAPVLINMGLVCIGLRGAIK